MASPLRYAAANQDVRSLLSMLGVDEYNATLIIAHMFIAPATTDMDMAPVIRYVEYLQRALIKLGAPLRASGEIDLPTAAAFDAVCGQDWPSMPWFQIGQCVIHAGDRGIRLTPPAPAPAMGFIPELPAIPGGVLGWAVAAAGAYFLFFHKR